VPGCYLQPNDPEGVLGRIRNGIKFRWQVRAGQRLDPDPMRKED
jgi:hypothetical protein